MPASARAMLAALMQAQRVPPSACSTCLLLCVFEWEGKVCVGECKHGVIQWRRRVHLHGVNHDTTVWPCCWMHSQHMTDLHASITLSNHQPCCYSMPPHTHQLPPLAQPLATSYRYCSSLLIPAHTRLSDCAAAAPGTPSAPVCCG